MSNIIKLELPIISVLGKDPVGSKVLERYVFVSTSEINAEQEQSGHEFIFFIIANKYFVSWALYA